MMADFLQNLVFNQVSFIIGLIAGALGFWLITRLVPALPRIAHNLRTKPRGSGSRPLTGNARRLQQDMLQYVQGLHLASALFALDEVLVEPGILAPPAPTEPGQESPARDMLSEILPYLPDWPELAARYSARTFLLATALSGGANLLLVGSPGSGKTTALAHLTCQIVRNESPAEGLSGLIPLYTHVADLFPLRTFDRPLVNVLCQAVHPQAKSLTGNKLEILLKQALLKGHILLLVDGLDEVDDEFRAVVISYLSALLEKFPLTRLVVASTPDNYAGLVELALVPVAIAAWDENQYLAFINKWSRSWYRHIRPLLDGGVEQIDPRLLNAWQLAENPIISPIDATLKAWAVFAGDIAGPGYIDLLESYIWRMTSHLKGARPALEDFALQLVASRAVAMDLKAARGLKADLEFEGESEREKSAAQKDITRRGKRSTRKLPGLLPELIENGILVRRAGDHFSFAHPLIMAYLASRALAEAPVSHFLSGQPDWSGKLLTLVFLAASRGASPEIEELLGDEDDFLLRAPLSVARWLHYVPHSAAWRSRMMRFLATELQANNIPFGLRARLLSALLLSGDPGVGVLLRQISHTSTQDLLHLSALGMGYLLDQQSLSRLGELITEPENNVSKSACFALVKIGNQQAFELLGAALLHGSDGTRRAVAEALALDPGEGGDMLKEAAEMEDLLVRRAAVFGLARLDQPWAREVLQKLALEDDEWLVRSAATQIIELEGAADRQIPAPPLPLHEVPWLVAFAGGRGIGIAPGQPAENLLNTALAEGSPEEQQAALECLQQYPNQEALPKIYENMKFAQRGVQQAAFNTLLAYAARGLNIKNPSRY